MNAVARFLGDETGAVTIDWVALTSGVLLLGIVAVFAIFNQGVGPLVGRINAALIEVDTVDDVGQPFDCNSVDSC